MFPYVPICSHMFPYIPQPLYPIPIYPHNHTDSKMVTLSFIHHSVRGEYIFLSAFCLFLSSSLWGNCIKNNDLEFALGDIDKLGLLEHGDLLEAVLVDGLVENDYFVVILDQALHDRRVHDLLFGLPAHEVNIVLAFLLVL